MRVNQYASFAVFSSDVPATEIEKRIGLSPDKTLVRDSKDPVRPVPIQHMWEVSSQRSDRSLYDQIEEVLSRIAPFEAALIDLLPDLGEGGYVFQIVRYLNDPDAPETETAGIGFGLEADQLALLTRLKARIDVDEYDCTLGDED